MDFVMNTIVTQTSCCNCYVLSNSRFSGHTTIKFTALPLSYSPHRLQRGSCVVIDAFGKNRKPESLFCYEKAIPEEIIEKPVGISLSQKDVGDNTRCSECEAKGAVLCATCSGSGLYVDSIMESQGIIVKIRCLGCGGTGNIMCSECGGRGHVGCPNL
ncbi:DnaJ/Hsp40 cysteine-rich domain superfamily protein [Heracleum sosnowskyi]|uniref:DnaJ/Hsp40 cysteine-rich domain superfamily protein n=1 Tax=Heracleum sosnowskyi TaxID=360622 RepID=A0AAD8J459_9APIA|nr:DnaJ/Hsp40 cysteine-rich domain superfamily protein [Heracleum sosnowskyi]